MLRELAALDLPWPRIHILQVDERVAPFGHPDRNLTTLLMAFPTASASGGPQIYPMPVADPDLHAGAGRYADTICKIAGNPPVFDLVHLGLGLDGHTASLVPGDPVLDVMDQDVAVTREYLGWRRLTLTYPVLNRARRIVWLVTGKEKSAVLVRLRTGDANIPAGRIHQHHALVFADRAAATTHAEVSPE
jgi:6-phosphogluconolactonase/glucosamine-6-phosphate isomerase/deaminase